MPPRLRTFFFWLHLVAGVAVCLAIVPMAATGTVLAFERQVVGWCERDVRVAGAPQLLPGALAAAVQVPEGATVETLQLERDPTRPAFVEARDGMWLVDPSNGHVLRRSGVREILQAAEDVHRSAGLFLVGARRLGSTFAGIAAVLMLLLALTGPWLWWPRNVSRMQLRRRAWFVREESAHARDFNWHHVIGIWLVAAVLIASSTGVLLSFDGVRDLVGEKLGALPQPTLTIDADTAGREAMRLAPEWSGLRLRWGRDGRIALRVRFRDGVRPTEWAQLESADERVSLRRYEDGGRGDKVLGWNRWLHTGQAFGLFGQAVWLFMTLGILVLVWTGLSLSLRRWARYSARRASTGSSRDAPTAG